jgi:hypothetical protein
MNLGARHDWEVEMNSSILSLISRSIGGLAIYSVFLWSRVDYTFQYIIRRALKCISTWHQDPSINTCMYSTYSINTTHENEWYLERRKSLHHATLERPATRRSCHDTHVLALALLGSLFLLFADDTQKYLV